MKKEGIVLKGISYQETSKIIYVLTSDGVESCLVRSANKLDSKKLSIISPLTKVSYFVTESKLPLLTDGELISSYDEIKTDIKKMTLAYEIMEMIYHFNETISDKKLLYEFSTYIFDEMAKNEDSYFYLFVFLYKFLYLLGIGPKVSKCVMCNSTSNLNFSVFAGGVVCEKHHELMEKKYSNEVITAIQKIYLTPLNKLAYFKIDDLTKLELREIIDLYYDKYLSYKSKTRKLIYGIYGY